MDLFFFVSLQIQCASNTVPQPENEEKATVTTEDTVPAHETTLLLDAGHATASNSVDRQDAGSETDYDIDAGASDPVDFELCFADIDLILKAPIMINSHPPLVRLLARNTKPIRILNVWSSLRLVTMGSPPTLSEDFYRNKLTQWLVMNYGLQRHGYGKVITY